MKSILLIGSTLIIFRFGYFIMGKIDHLIEKREAGVDKRTGL